jgi:hypothetical protein
MFIPSPTPRRCRSLLSLNAGIAAPREEEKFLALEGGGFVVASHAAPAGAAEPDFVAVAEAFVGTPYLWGGRTSIGLDCSGLVQLALEAAGHAAPRDADMQAQELGRVIDLGPGAAFRRGDLSGRSCRHHDDASDFSTPMRLHGVAADRSRSKAHRAGGYEVVLRAAAAGLRQQAAVKTRP